MTAIMDSDIVSMDKTETSNSQILRPTQVSSTSSLESSSSINTFSLNQTSLQISASNAILPKNSISFPNSLPLTQSQNMNGLKMNYPLIGTTESSDAMKNISFLPSSLTTNLGVSDGTGAIVTNTTVPEFLYQLTKMLTDDNREIIEWSNGKIEVHNPHRLASDVLHKYFRHSKYASFQRQLNYFGFRKLAGKGKMAPCSYVNEAATSDLRSLLTIKRKTGTSTRDKKNNRQEGIIPSDLNKKLSTPTHSIGPVVNPVLAGILNNSHPLGNKRSRSLSNTSESDSGMVAKIAIGKGVKHQLNGYLKSPASTVQSPSSHTTNCDKSVTVKTETQSGVICNGRDHLALAQSAVGKGVRHQFSIDTPPQSVVSTGVSVIDPGGNQCTEASDAIPSASAAQFTFLEPSQLGMDIGESLSELQNNFQNSLNERCENKEQINVDNSSNKTVNSTVCNLRRDSSLVELAMIPPIYSVDPTPVTEMASDRNAMTFIDFPSSDLDPSHEQNKS